MRSWAILCAVTAAGAADEAAGFDLSVPHEGLEEPSRVAPRAAPVEASTAGVLPSAGALVVGLPGSAPPATDAAPDSAGDAEQAEIPHADTPTRTTPTEEARPSARAPPVPMQAMSVDEYGASQALVESEVTTEVVQHKHHSHGSHHAAAHQPVHDARTHHEPRVHHDARKHQQHQQRQERSDEGDTLDREADEVLHDYGSQRQWEKLMQVKKATFAYKKGIEQKKLVEEKRKIVAKRKAQLAKDVQKMETLKEAEATMISEIKENQQTLHMQLFGAEEAAAEQARVDARTALEYRHKLKLIAYLVVLVALASLVFGAYQGSKPQSLGTAWLAPFKKAEAHEAEPSSASTDVAEAQHA